MPQVLGPPLLAVSFSWESLEAVKLPSFQPLTCIRLPSSSQPG
jgi:hypothetical protein